MCSLRSPGIVRSAGGLDLQHGAGAPAQADRSGLRPRVAECPASGYPYGADQEERGAAPPAAPRFFQGAVPAQKIKTAPKERCGSKNGFSVIGENWGNVNYAIYFNLLKKRKKTTIFKRNSSKMTEFRWCR